MINSPSIAKFTAFVQLKDFLDPTKKESVRYELERLFTVGTPHPKQRALLMTVYGAGLRLHEACHLKAEHLDSARHQIRVVQGKGKRDGYTLLSPRLLQELRQYWKCCRPPDWIPHEQSGVAAQTQKANAPGIRQPLRIRVCLVCFGLWWPLSGHEQASDFNAGRAVAGPGAALEVARIYFPQ